MGVFDIFPRAPFFILRNDVSGNLLAGIADSDLSIDVDISLALLGWTTTNNDMRAYATLREGANVEVVVVTEAVDLSAGVSSTLTISRAADGTTAHAFTTAATISLNTNAGLLGHLAGNPLPAIVGGSSSQRYGVYGNATTEANISVSTTAYIHLPTEHTDWRRATIMLRNASAGTPALSWMANLPITWAGGSAPAFGASVDYILVEIYHHYDQGRLFGRWWGFDV